MKVSKVLDTMFSEIELLGQDGMWYNISAIERKEEECHIKIKFDVPLETLEFATFLFKSG
jgi:hypothetical protein